MMNATSYLIPLLSKARNLIYLGISGRTSKATLTTHTSNLCLLVCFSWSTIKQSMPARNALVLLISMKKSIRNKRKWWHRISTIFFYKRTPLILRLLLRFTYIIPTLSKRNLFYVPNAFSKEGERYKSKEIYVLRWNS